MGEALYRKYRSKSLGEIVGQEHITTTLRNALKSGKISHAYLFTGPKGVGKTSIARILAYEVNGIPYADSSTSHLDIIEIDAASNRRIDEIRELRDKVHIAPASAKYKVYIIDEVHMLTKEAFNALLKTLEEPPEHVIFILATTEAHKLPETIISRTQRFTFKPVDTDKVVAHLKSIAKKEKIDISDEALELLAEHGEGSFRDSISMLDQVGSIGKSVDADEVRRAIGVPPNTAVTGLNEQLLAKDAKGVVRSLDTLYEGGYQPAQIAKALSAELRIKILSGSQPDLIPLLRQLVGVSASSNPKAMLELVLLEYALEGSEVTSSQPKPTTPRQDITPSESAQETPKPSGDIWQKTLQSLKGSHNTLYGIVRMAEARIDGNELVLAFAFPFHQRRCNEARNIERIKSALEQTSGRQFNVSTVLDKSIKPTPAKQPSAKTVPSASRSDTLESITNVFGGGEVLDE